MIRKRQLFFSQEGPPLCKTGAKWQVGGCYRGHLKSLLLINKHQHCNVNPPSTVVTPLAPELPIALNINVGDIHYIAQDSLHSL